MSKVSSCRSTLYRAILAANAGLLLNHAPVVFAQQTQALQEVVVTARKREESVQDVPIAVSAFSAEQLAEAGVRNVKDMATMVPGVQIDQSSVAQIWIRGVGQRDVGSRIDGPVGVYLDGIYLARKEGQLLDVFDIESMQVLRGPQGTLFGKNTTAGALVMNTRKPSNTFNGSFETRLGNYNRRDAKLILDMPIVEDLLLSKVSLASVKRDGYLKNVVEGVSDRDMASEDRMAVNLQLRWMPTDTLTVDTFLYAGKTREVQAAMSGKLLNKSGYAGQDSLLQNYMWPGDTTPVWAWEGAPPQLGLGAMPAGFNDVSATYRNAYARSAGLDYDEVMSNTPHSHFNVDNYIGGITAEWEINDNLAFKSITGYGYQRVSAYATTPNDGDGTDLIFQQFFNSQPSPREQISQEFQFTGSAMDDRLQYTAGVFAMVEDIEDYNEFTTMPSGVYFPEALFPIPGGAVIVNPPSATRDKYELKNTTMAAFFQSSYDITDNLQATAGLRWTSEKRENTVYRSMVDMVTMANRIAAAGIPGVFPIGPGQVAIAGAALPLDPLSQIMALFPRDAQGFYSYPYTTTRYDADKTWTDVSPMFSLSYKLPDQWIENTPIDGAMTYFTYSEGFKSGTFEPVGTQGLMTVDPETIENYEVGLKLDAFDRTVRFNMAAYHMKYDNMQLRQVIPDGNGASAVVLTNASSSEITGVEAEFNWQPITGLLISASGSVNDYDYKDFSDARLSTYHLYTGQPAPEFDRSSEGFAEVPSKTAGLAVQYTFDIGIGTLTPRIQYNYTSEVFLGLDPGAWGVRDQGTVDAYDRVDARIGYRSPDERFELGLYATNLTNEEYYQGASSVGDSTGALTLIASEPRMYGVEMLYRFGD